MKVLALSWVLCKLDQRSSRTQLSEGRYETDSNFAKFVLVLADKKRKWALLKSTGDNHSKPKYKEDTAEMSCCCKVTSQDLRSNIFSDMIQNAEITTTNLFFRNFRCCYSLPHSPSYISI